MPYDKTCTIYPFITTLVDEQEVQSYSATAIYTWSCDYRDKAWKGTDNNIVVQDNVSLIEVDLKWIVEIPRLSKVVLDNWSTYKTMRDPQQFTLWSISNTLLVCMFTDG